MLLLVCVCVDNVVEFNVCDIVDDVLMSVEVVVVVV